MENIQTGQDIAQTIADCPFLRELDGKTVFITGATGLIGSLLARTLLTFDRVNGTNIKVIACVRNIQKAHSVFADYLDLPLGFCVGDILNPIECDQSVDFVIHGASNTASRVFVEKPVETIQVAVNGTQNALNFALGKKAHKFVYLSSMEVFGVTDERLDSVKESDYGYIDILNTRSSYSESKRLCECLCASFADEFGLNVSIARLTQTLGAGIDYNDTRVAAQFMRAAIEGHDIVLKTEGKTRRPIVYASDAISAIFTILLRGQPAQCYTVANTSTLATIKETAQMVCDRICNGRIQLKFDIDVPKEYAPNLNLNLNLNTEKLESLGWRAQVSLEQAYQRMINAFSPAT